MASIPNDIAEIRRTVYGKQMREPIADACLHLKNKYKDLFVKRLDSVEIRAIKVSEDEYYADSCGILGLTVDNIEDNDYLLTDNRLSDSVISIGESDYLYNLRD